jgi:CheY-like chemotaxis protein
VETAQPLIDTMRHQLTVSLPQQQAELHVDPVRLIQVFGNLLNNAAKYMEPGGKIWLTAEFDDGFVTVRVSDVGIGIDPAMLPRIFDLFMQADHTATRSQCGLGIGLTLVKRLVEIHGGTVEARSPGLGQGSEFLVRLPLARVASSPSALVSLEEKSCEKGRRVLVVDDNVDAAESLAMLLRLIGQTVIAVHHGSDAIARAETERFDLIFLDLGMPGMDGYEVAQRLKRLPNSRAATLIAVTGWGQAEHRERCQAAGFHYHLIKPADLRSLQEILRMVFGEA